MQNPSISVLCSQSLRRLLVVLHPPADQPGQEQALRAAYRTLVALRQHLPSPDHVLIDLCEEFAPLDGPLRDVSAAYERRLASYPLWFLLLRLTDSSPDEWMAAVGSLIALSLVETKPVPAGKVRTLLTLRRESPSANDTQHPLVRSLLAEAERRFTVGSVLLADPDQRAQIAKHYKSHFKYLGEHAQQARSSSRTLTGSVLCAATRELRARVEDGCATAMLQALALCSGLSLELTRSLPLNHPSLHDWGAMLDLDHGTLSLDLELVAPGARRMVSPLDGGSPEGSPPDAGRRLPASRILVRPLPGFLHVALQAQAQRIPQALCVDELLDSPQTSSYDEITATASVQRLKPSLARAANAIEAYAVREAGIHRVVAGMLSGRFETETKSKLYYSTLSRHTIWQAAQTLFERLGWGEPVALVMGLPVGSQTTPECAQVQDWAAWLAEQVRCAEPGRNAGPARLAAYHNTLARAAAALVGCAVALRDCAPLPFLADLDLNTSVIFFSDKHSPSVWAPDGRSGGPHPVPFTPTAREQIRLYRAHCTKLARRLRRVAGWESSCETLEAIGRADPVPLFVRLDESTHQALPLKTQDLVRWWPASLQFAGNWWRSYWQTRLIEQGVASRSLNLLMRHMHQGERLMSSDRGDALPPMIHEVIRALETEFDRIGLQAMQGLGR